MIKEDREANPRNLTGKNKLRVAAQEVHGRGGVVG